MFVVTTDQNIYQWRGSDVTHIREFATTYDDVATVPLEETSGRRQPSSRRRGAS